MTRIRRPLRALALLALVLGLACASGSEEESADGVYRFNAAGDVWEELEVVSELPGDVVYVWQDIDSRWAAIGVGNAMPTSPFNGELFDLLIPVTVPQNLAAGIYAWNASAVSWVAQAAPPSGVTFPPNPVNGELFLLMPADGELVVLSSDNGVYLLTGAIWVKQPDPPSGSDFPASPVDGELFRLVGSN